MRSNIENLGLNPKDKIFIFGAGKGGKKCLNLLKEVATVIGVIDNDSCKQGLMIEGIPIFGPERLKRKEFDKIIIASVYWAQIKHQLKKMGFVEGKDFDLFIPTSCEAVWRMKANKTRFVEKVKRGLWFFRNRYIFWLPLPVQLPWGVWWLAWNDVMGKHIYFCEDFERGEQKFLLQFLQPEMIVIDIGAHHGLYTLLGSKKVGPHGRVIAFEPSPRELKNLRWHLILNRCYNVHTENSAVHSKKGTYKFFVCGGQETGCNSLHPFPDLEIEQVVEVPVTTLDYYLEKHHISQIDLSATKIEQELFI